MARLDHMSPEWAAHDVEVVEAGGVHVSAVGMAGMAGMAGRWRQLFWLL